MRRYLTLFWVQFRASSAAAMQYRVDFLVQGGISFFWALLTLIPLWVVFSSGRTSVAGWSYPEALVVLGWFTLLKALLEGAINPSLIAVVDHIRKGTLDFVLLKPADAQFLVSTAKFEFWKVSDALAALGIFVYAFHELGRVPTPLHLLQALALLVIAAGVIYSLWIIVISMAFYVVRIDNLSYLFVSIYDAARWPVSMFTGALRFVFTYVIPLALMTTYPAMALLGTLEGGTWIVALAGGVVFSGLARAVWTMSLSRYTSASS